MTHSSLEIVGYDGGWHGFRSGNQEWKIELPLGMFCPEESYNFPKLGVLTIFTYGQKPLLEIHPDPDGESVEIVNLKEKKFFFHPSRKYTADNAKYSDNVEVFGIKLFASGRE
ncbi:hypothetical protein [Shimazuella alba]|uniref:Uncharacterized protein n=1 Tax=Shimazuella alba TaxID=2690964 RepID=A0A6I4W1D8_9BACL|nr:hypothetical protein [Shimazuella alba]MXQ54062.1 hypothetical protein [Shimazuella alba]